MFLGCTGLTKAPELPAMTLAEYCYCGMFSDCTGLTQAPMLPATTLADKCYSDMFHNCTGLTKTPELPATTLAESCYNYMFYGCTELTEAPELPAMTLAEGCYSWMFSYCRGLAEAPELPATTLVAECYNNMFRGCTKLSSVTCLATNISTDATSHWLYNVSETGIFVKHPDMKEWSDGSDGIPKGWTVVDYDMTDIIATTVTAKKVPASTYDLRGMKSANKNGLMIIDRKKVVVR